MKNNNQNENAFTLIELLAVIVILAVIALIAVPQVLSILEKSSKHAAESSVYGILESADTYVADFMLQNSATMPREPLRFSCSNSGCNLITELSSYYDIEGLDQLKFKGTKPTSGTITVNKNGENIFVTDIVINGYTCNFAYDNVACTKGDEIEYIHSDAGEVVYFNPVTAKKCESSDEGCMKWYKYSENNSLGTVNMILDHNTTANVSYYSVFEQLSMDTADWDDNLNIRLIMADEVAAIIEREGFDVTNPGRYRNPFVGYTWLYDNISSGEIEGNGYWTSDKANEETAWGVKYAYFGHPALDYTYHGVRPVITVLKSKIQS